MLEEEKRGDKMEGMVQKSLNSPIMMSNTELKNEPMDGRGLYPSAYDSPQQRLKNGNHANKFLEWLLSEIKEPLFLCWAFHG